VSASACRRAGDRFATFCRITFSRFELDRRTRGDFETTAQADSDFVPTRFFGQFVLRISPSSLHLYILASSQAVL